MADLPLLEGWLREAHVARWYGGTNLLSDLPSFIAADWITPFILERDEQAIGYLQAYRPHAYTAEPHPYNDLPARSVGIDMLIGDPTQVGRGLGPAFIEAFSLRPEIADSPCLFSDPDPANAVAIRAYGKAGLVPAGERNTPWGRVLLMIRPRATEHGRQP
jgi:aminoglycoside 6'-N-acetyltransferase